MPLIRLASHLLPHVRQTGVGVSLLLERAAQPGLTGLAMDVARVMAGTRQLGVAVGGITFTLPPLVMLIEQAALLGLSTNTGAYCSTQARCSSGCGL
ncbi:hypothetical protein ABPG75_013765 [Micractinium tetrahymenae]